MPVGRHGSAPLARTRSCAVLLFAIGMAIGRRGDSPDAPSPPTVDGHRDEDSPRAVPSEINASLQSGYARTRAGRCLRRPTAYVGALDGPRPPRSAIASARRLTAIASSEAREALVRAYAQAATQAREQLGVGTAPEPVVILRAVAGRVSGRRFTPTRRPSRSGASASSAAARQPSHSSRGARRRCRSSGRRRLEGRCAPELSPDRRRRSPRPPRRPTAPSSSPSSRGSRSSNVSCREQHRSTPRGCGLRARCSSPRSRSRRRRPRRERRSRADPEPVRPARTRPRLRRRGRLRRRRRRRRRRTSSCAASPCGSRTPQSG